MGLKKMKKTELTKGQKRMWNVLEFLIRLLILSIPVYLILILAVDLSPLQNAVASHSASLLKALGYNVFQDGYHIIVGTVQDPFYFMINEDCTGWKSMLFLFALIFAVPRIAMKKRVLGLVIGLPIIWVGNLMRVLGVVMAEAAWGLDFALALHDYGYRLGLVALVLIIWIVWLKLSKKEKKNIWGKMSDLFRLR
jgi:exosortase/archaeosortase family protein